MGQRDQVLRVLAKDLRRYMEKLDIDYRLLQEIRIRADAPLMVVYHGKEYFVGRSGCLTTDPEAPLMAERQDVKETMERISNYSMYAFEEELKQGFITIQGGHRVGVAGENCIGKGSGEESALHIIYQYPAGTPAVRVRGQSTSVSDQRGEHLSYAYHITAALWEDNAAA